MAPSSPWANSDVFVEYTQEEVGPAEIPCGDADGPSLFALQMCALTENCATAASAATCILTNCNAEFSSLSASCVSCLSANANQTDIDAIFGSCVTASAQGSLVFGGHHGMMLVSKLPLQNKDYLNFDPFAT